MQFTALELSVHSACPCCMATAPSVSDSDTHPCTNPPASGCRYGCPTCSDPVWMCEDCWEGQSEQCDKCEEECCEECIDGGGEFSIRVNPKDIHFKCCGLSPTKAEYRGDSFESVCASCFEELEDETEAHKEGLIEEHERTVKECVECGESWCALKPCTCRAAAAADKKVADRKRARALKLQVDLETADYDVLKKVLPKLKSKRALAAAAPLHQWCNEFVEAE